MTQRTTRELTDGLVATCRTVLGDTLRSVVHFTPTEYEVLYLRSDLGADPSEARAAKRELVENERLGFTSRETYGELKEAPGVEESLGDYVFTVRGFTDGYLARVLVGEHGVLVTTDAMDIDAFEEFAVATNRTLASLAGE
jgi:hypothetical protein